MCGTETNSLERVCFSVKFSQLPRPSEFATRAVLACTVVQREVHMRFQYEYVGSYIVWLETRCRHDIGNIGKAKY